MWIEKSTRFLRHAHSAEDVRIDNLIMFSIGTLGNSGPEKHRTCQVHPTYDWKISGPFEKLSDPLLRTYSILGQHKCDEGIKVSLAADTLFLKILQLPGMYESGTK